MNMDRNELPQASSETMRLIRWRTRRRIRDAVIAILVVVVACLVLALVSGLDRMFDRIG
jgi:preprotein translocase subunit SecE